MHRCAWRSGVALVLAGALFGLGGCTYLKHRAEDALDMMDLGVTFSSEPGFAAYYDLTPFIPIGFGYVDGHFAGVGGGKVGVMKYHQMSVGVVVWGREQVGFGDDFRVDDPASMNDQTVGIGGVLQGLGEGRFPGPDYFPTCLHYLHFGYVGLVWNLRYLQILDFLLGWTTLDIAFDDGVRGPARWGGKNLIGFSRDQAAPEYAEPEKEVGTLALPPPPLDEPVVEPPPKKVTQGPARTESKPKNTPPPRPPKPPPEKPRRPETPPEGFRTYVVKKGDIGVMNIARKELGDPSRWREIIKLNRLRPPYRIRAGQELLLPTK